MYTQFENFLDQAEIRKQIEILESKAFIYSELDHVRMNAIILEIKALEMKLLDLMVESAIID
jgi:hypothetical protein